MGYKKAKQVIRPKARFLNLTPKPVQIPISFFKNFFTAKKHIVVLSSPSTKYTNLLLSAVKNGLQIEVNKVFLFARYKEAYEYAEQGGYIGKVAIELN